MKYMLLLFENASWEDDPTYDADGTGARHQAFGQWCAEKGIVIDGGSQLRGASSATTLRQTGDAVVVADGPAIELSESLGGYYVIDAPSRELAIEAGRRVPSGKIVDVRPVWDFADGDQAQG